MSHNIDFTTLTIGLPLLELPPAPPPLLTAFLPKKPTKFDFFACFFQIPSFPAYFYTVPLAPYVQQRAPY